MYKFISWNVNGLRAVCGKGFADIFEDLDADFFCLQETKLQEGQIDLEFLDTLSTNELLNELMKIKGVGMKVASCVALFGYGRLDAFPIDVWVKRVFDHYYPSGFDFKSLGDKAGLVQQYLFYYERYKNIVL